MKCISTNHEAIAALNNAITQNAADQALLESFKERVDKAKATADEARALLQNAPSKDASDRYAEALEKYESAKNVAHQSTKAARPVIEAQCQARLNETIEPALVATIGGMRALQSNLTDVTVAIAREFGFDRHFVAGRVFVNIQEQENILLDGLETIRRLRERGDQAALEKFISKMVATVAYHSTDAPVDKPAVVTLLREFAALSPERKASAVIASEPEAVALVKAFNDLDPKARKTARLKHES